QEPPPLPSGLVSPAVERVIRRCLEKDPDRRFRAADDVAFALEAVTDAPPTPATRDRRSRRWAPWTMTALVLMPAAFALQRWISIPRSGSMALKRLTSDAGLTTDPALSRDGKLVAYASDRAGEGNLDIWVQ